MTRANPLAWQTHAAISDAIEQFANRMAAGLERAAGPRKGAVAAALLYAAEAVHEAGKSPRTRRREARKVKP